MRKGAEVGSHTMQAATLASAPTPCALHSVERTLHCKVYRHATDLTLHCKVYFSPSLKNVFQILHTAQRSRHIKLGTLYSVLCSLHTTQCTLNTSLCTVYSAHFTLHSVLCSLHTPQCTLNTSLCILCSAHFTSLLNGREFCYCVVFVGIWHAMHLPVQHLAN